jgi:hypothetical protein
MKALSLLLFVSMLSGCIIFAHSYTFPGSRFANQVPDPTEVVLTREELFQNLLNNNRLRRIHVYLDQARNRPPTKVVEENEHIPWEKQAFNQSILDVIINIVSVSTSPRSLVVPSDLSDEVKVGWLYSPFDNLWGGNIGISRVLFFFDEEGIYRGLLMRY